MTCVRGNTHTHSLSFLFSHLFAILHHEKDIAELIAHNNLVDPHYVLVATRVGEKQRDFAQTRKWKSRRFHFETNAFQREYCAYRYKNTTQATSWRWDRVYTAMGAGDARRRAPYRKCVRAHDRPLQKCPRQCSSASPAPTRCDTHREPPLEGVAPHPFESQP